MYMSDIVWVCIVWVSILIFQCLALIYVRKTFCGLLQLASLEVIIGIPDDVLIERPVPNEEDAIVQGHGDRIPVRAWLIHQARLQIPISPMLKEVWHIADLLLCKCQ